LWNKGYFPYCRNGKKSFQEKRRGIGINTISVRKCILLLGDISSKCFNSEGPSCLLHCIKRTAAGLYAVFRPSDVYDNLLGDDVSIRINLPHLSLAMENVSPLLFFQLPHYNLRK
jgi:hypothetical protein